MDDQITRQKLSMGCKLVVKHCCHFFQVVCDSQFVTDPHGAAKTVWESYESPSNGAVMRTAVLGIVHFHNLDEVVTNAIRICKATHYDPRLAQWL